MNTPHPLNPVKVRKFRNKKVLGADGLVFDSQAEARRWGELQMLERAGQLSDLKRQVAYVLCPAVRLGPANRLKPAMKLIVDFQYVDEHTGKLVLEDVKGIVTEIFRLKQHLLKDKTGLEVRLHRC